MVPPRPAHFALFALGGTALAGVAGFVNAVTFLAPGHLTATHMTGTATRLALTGVDPSGPFNAALAGLALVLFVLGAAVSGAVLDSTRLALGRRYGLLLMFEAAFLALGASLYRDGIAEGVLPAAFASGVQNALATQYSAAIVRTTHVTGVVTDLGIALGKLLARRGVDGWRVALYLGLLGGFVAGGVVGGFASGLVGTDALYLPAGFLGLVGFAYWVMRQAGYFRGRETRQTSRPSP